MLTGKPLTIGRIALEQPPRSRSRVDAVRQPHHPGKQEIFRRPRKLRAHGKGLSDQTAGIVLMMQR